MFTRDSVPIDATLAELKSYLEGTLGDWEVKLNELWRGVEILYTTTGFTIGYLWDDSGTSQADPGLGYMRGNAANLSSVSTLWISKESAFSQLDVGLLIPTLVGEVYLLDSPDGSNYSYGSIASWSDLGTYYAAGLTVTAAKGNPQQNDLMALRLIPGVFG